MVAVADRGDEGIAWQCEGDVKLSMMVMTSIDVVGSTLPLWITCRGKTH
jgi:hypothetical protein